MWKKGVLAALLCCSVAVMAGCGSQDGAAARKEKGEVVVTAGDYILKGDYDPINGWGHWGPDPIHSGLYKYVPDKGLEKDLATDVQLSPDGKTYTVTLRDGVKFSDGTPMTAEDVAFTFMESKRTGSVVDMSYVENVEAVNPTTVVFHLNKAWDALPYTMANIGIVSKASYDKQTPSKAIGTGPWKIADFQKEQQLVLVPNEYYYGEKPKLKKVTVVNIASDSTLAAAKSGQVDIVFVTPDFAKAEVPDMRMVSMPTLETFTLNLPVEPEHVNEKGETVGNNVTSDPAIRKALNIGISRQNIIDHAMNGMATPAFGFSRALDWTNPNLAFKDGQVEEAKKILDAAGWVDTDGDGWRDKNGKNAEIVINGRSNDVDRYNTAVAVAEEAKKLGLHVVAKSTAWSEALKVAYQFPTTWSLGGSNPQVLYNYLDGSQIGVNGYHNSALYNSPFVNATLAKAFAATTREEALRYFHAAQGPEGMEKDVPYLWILHPDLPYFVRNGLDVGPKMTVERGQGMGIFYTINEWHW